MGDVVNLNKFRKRKAREDKQAKAAQNRVVHGEDKAERSRREKERALEDKRVDGHRLDSDKPDDE